MMILAAFALSAAPAPVDLGPFMDEPVAADALEAHISCLGQAAFDRSSDTRGVQVVAAEVVASCAATAASLRTALIEVYGRKPDLGPGEAPVEAAEIYVADLDARVIQTINEIRNRRID
jgi:hypothetical protein